MYLVRKNLKTRRLSNILDYIKLGLFLIVERTRLVNYRLDLPKGIRIYSIFYVLLLELVPLDARL